MGLFGSGMRQQVRGDNWQDELMAQGAMPGAQEQMPAMPPPERKLGMFGRIGNFLANPNPLFGAGTAVLAASGNPVGEGLFAFQQQARKSREDELDSEYRRAQIDWMKRRGETDNTPDWQQKLMAAGLTPGTPEYQAAIKQIAGLGPQAGKAPPTRERISGGTTIQEEMQPDGTWRQIGSGPRWSPNGGVTINNQFPQFEYTQLPDGSIAKRRVK